MRQLINFKANLNRFKAGSFIPSKAIRRRRLLEGSSSFGNPLITSTATSQEQNVTRKYFAFSRAKQTPRIMTRIRQARLDNLGWSVLPSACVIIKPAGLGRDRGNDDDDVDVEDGAVAVPGANVTVFGLVGDPTFVFWLMILLFIVVVVKLEEVDVDEDVTLFSPKLLKPSEDEDIDVNSSSRTTRRRRIPPSTASSSILSTCWDNFVQSVTSSGGYSTSAN